MPTQIPADLLVHAYFASNGEPAWCRAEALTVIAWAAAGKIPILGAEVWIPTVPGPTIPTPYIYAFEPKRVSGESPAQFVVRASEEVAEYVRSFEWDNSDKAHQSAVPFFNITFG
jgi:hypothetical protein